MATLSKLTPGQTVWSLETVGVGNTTLRRKALYAVMIVEIDTDKRMALASWNGNTARWYGERAIKKWRVKKPEPKGTDALGYSRY